METLVKKIAAHCGEMILFLLLVSIGACNSRGDRPVTDTGVPYYNTPDFTPTFATDKNAIDTFHTVGSFSFTDQYGNTITNKSVAGKIYLANFFYTSCPSICPKMTTTMKMVYDHYKNNPHVCFLSHSVTPDLDSVSVLRHYALSKGVTGDQWHFLTGDKNAIYNIARKSYFIEELQGFSKDSTQFLHTENFVLVDQHDHIRGLYNGTLTAEVPRIISDIDALLKADSD